MAMNRPPLTPVAQSHGDQWVELAEIHSPRDLSPPAPAHNLDGAARSNLTPAGMARYEDLKRDLAAREVSLDDWDDILGGFIWGEIEADSAGEDDAP